MLLHPYEVYRRAIDASGFSIYDLLDSTDDLWLPSSAIEFLLNQHLHGLSLAGMANRTKSKEVKAAVCQALGYPVPPAFQRTSADVPAQHLEVHIQKALNLQIYNPDPDAGYQRFALIEQRSDDTIGRTRVVDLETLLKDDSGTLTSKYQARLVEGSASESLFAMRRDTAGMAPHVRHDIELTPWDIPTAQPASGSMFSLPALEARLATLIGTSFPDPGVGQERKRGEAVHRLACERLGYQSFGDCGNFPDIPHQLLEVKLQTSRTIDLGVTAPDCTEELALPAFGGYRARHRDVRYAVFFAETDGSSVTITRAVLTSGEDFFTVFSRCEGLQVNEKLQVKLPNDFFTQPCTRRVHVAGEGWTPRYVPPAPRKVAQFSLF